MTHKAEAPLHCENALLHMREAMNNQLYYGDNLDVLRRKVRDESVDLCYIDPPFNSKRNYFQIYNNIGKDDAAQAQAFIDTWTWNELTLRGFQEIITNEEGRYTEQTVELIKGLKAVLKENNSLLAYLVSITQRVNEIWRVLKPTGSFYLHCDPTASHYLKLVLDSVFCGGGRGGDYINEIIWRRQNAKGLAFARFASNHDIILKYAKSNKRTWQAQYKEHNPEYLNKKYRFVESETGRMYRLDNLTNPNKDRPSLTYEFLGVTRVWRWTKERMEEAYKQGLIVQTKPGGVPQLKRYLDEQEGTAIDDLWDDITPINSQAVERLGYPTQKPEALLERIIQASSNEGDTVLDAYCGCGTTIAVAQRLHRNWIGIDITYQSIAVILKRLEDSFGADAMNAVTLDGIPRDLASAQALAQKKDDRLRKEFEKWAVLTYSQNRAAIQNRKGADRGIDGLAYFMTGADTTAKMIFQVKSGKVQRADIATLNSDRIRESAEMAVFLTLEEPTKPMRDEALAAGIYHHELLHRDYPRIQIITVQALLDGQRIELPLSVDVLKSARAATQHEQRAMF